MSDTHPRLLILRALGLGDLLIEEKEERNRGAFARNLGVEELNTPFVAFSDDDSWWEPGALARAEAAFRFAFDHQESQE